MASRTARRTALALGLALGSCLFASACDRSTERGESRAAGRPAAAPESARNEPIAVRVNGREVRVRCELECEPLDAELGRLWQGCRTDPMRAPHLVSVGGESLVALGCCTETETAYREACGLEGALSRCGSEWAARCARGGT